MIGKTDGQVRYVMGFGGLFGMGEDNYPLPWTHSNMIPASAATR